MPTEEASYASVRKFDSKGGGAAQNISVTPGSFSWSPTVPSAAGALVSLPRALEIIAAQIYDGKNAMSVVRTELFDGLAGTVSALAPLFVLDSGAAARPLSEEELDKALFRKGGSEMYFVDGRAPIGNLAVTAEGIAKVLRILKGISLPD